MPDRPFLFLPECHADTALIRFLFPEPLLIIHESGCPEVAKTMMSPRASEYTLIGIVDNDQKLGIHQKGFFKAFDVIEDRDKLSLRKHPHTNQHIIVVDKAIESFLLWNVEQVGIEMSAYGFASNAKQLGKQTKLPIIETDPNYLQLLTDLHTKKAPGFLTLERILNDIITT